MVLGAWRHADEPPPVERMADHMNDAARERWRRLTHWFRTTYSLDGEPAWEGDETGWVLRYRRRDRPLATLAPAADGRFGALVVVGPSHWAEVRAASVSERTREAFESATGYEDGRWLWLRVHDDAAVDDLCTLVALKSPPPRRIARRRVLVASSRA